MNVSKFVVPALTMLSHNSPVTILPSITSVRKQSVGKIAAVLAEEGTKYALEESGKDEKVTKRISKVAGRVANIGVRMVTSETPLKYLAVVSTCIAVNSLVNKGIDTFMEDDKRKESAKNIAGAAIYICASKLNGQDIAPAFVKRSIGKAVKRGARFGVRNIISRLRNNKEKNQEVTSDEDVTKCNKEYSSHIDKILDQREQLNLSYAIYK